MFILSGMRGRNGEIGYGVYVMECPGMCGIIGMYWIHRVWHGLCGSVGWGDWSDHVQPQARGSYGAGWGYGLDSRAVDVMENLGV